MNRIKIIDQNINSKRMQKGGKLEGKVADNIGEGKVWFFSKTYCPYCTEAKKTLDSWGIQYNLVECDVDELTDAQQKELTELTGIKTFPNIFIGTKSTKGCDDLKKLIKEGKLVKILEEQKVPFTQP